MVAETTVNGATAGKQAAEIITITPPNFRVLPFTIKGISPYVQCRFSEKAMQDMRATQAAGSTARKGKKREPKDFDAAYEGAKHVAEEGWYGIPAPAFRNAMISACRVVGFQMTKAKLAVFVEADGIDKVDATPLVQITKGQPSKFESVGRNATGVADLRVRAKWAVGWEAVVRVRFDADMFTPSDIYNLMARVGLQVGIGEGRPDSRASAGQGWGVFEIVSPGSAADASES